MAAAAQSSVRWIQSPLAPGCTVLDFSHRVFIVCWWSRIRCGLHDFRALGAVKLLRNGFSEGDREEFLREAEAMLDMDHPQVVGLVGVVVQEAPWLLVLSYHQYGDLKSLLDVCRSNEVALRVVEQLAFCVQICKGMVRKQLLEEHFSSLLPLLGVFPFFVGSGIRIFGWSR